MIASSDYRIKSFVSTRDKIGGKTLCAWLISARNFMRLVDFGGKLIRMRNYRISARALNNWRNITTTPRYYEHKELHENTRIEIHNIFTPSHPPRQPKLSSRQLLPFLLFEPVYNLSDSRWSNCSLWSQIHFPVTTLKPVGRSSYSCRSSWYNWG